MALGGDHCRGIAHELSLIISTKPFTVKNDSTRPLRNPAISHKPFAARHRKYDFGAAAFPPERPLFYQRQKDDNLSNFLSFLLPFPRNFVTFVSLYTCIFSRLVICYSHEVGGLKPPVNRKIRR